MADDDVPGYWGNGVDDRVRAGVALTNQCKSDAVPTGDIDNGRNRTGVRSIGFRSCRRYGKKRTPDEPQLNVVFAVQHYHLHCWYISGS